MNGLNKASGAATTIVLKGETLILKPLVVEDFGVIENHLLANRPNLLRLAIEAAADVPKGIPQDLIDKMIDRAIARAEKSRKVTSEEVAEWLDTRDGVAFTLWLMLEKSYSGRFTLEHMNQVLADMEPEKVKDLIDRRDDVSALSEPAKNDERQGEAA